MARKQPAIDPDELALIEWCTHIEELFIAAGVFPRKEAQAAYRRGSRMVHRYVLRRPDPGRSR